MTGAPIAEQTILFNSNLYVRLFKIAWVKIDPDWWNLHTTQSSFWRFYLNYEAGAEVEVAGIRSPLLPEHLYVIPAGVKFVTHITRDVGQFYIHFDVIGLPHMANSDLFRSVITLPDMPDIAAQTYRLARDVRAGKNDAIQLQCRSSALLYQSLGCFFEHLSAEQQLRYADQSTAVEPVRPAIHAIETHYSDHMSNAELAQLCCMSETYFITRFRKCVGLTPGQYLQAYRIRMVSQALLFSDATVDQVAEKNGFPSRSHFIRTFRRHTGMTPTQYRQQPSLW